MSEQDYTDAADSGTQDLPESQASDPPVLDMSAIEDATNAHELAVNTAHETLASRTKNAYDIYGADLDRAYRDWQNAVNEIRQRAGLENSTGGPDGEQAGDPASAR